LPVKRLASNLTNASELASARLLPHHDKCMTIGHQHIDLRDIAMSRKSDGLFILHG